MATLWAVHDLSTALLMNRLYYYHIAEKMSISSSLTRAQSWLRRSDAREIVGVVEELPNIVGRDLMDYLQDEVDKLRAVATMDPDLRPFEHPFYWAAFLFLGAV